MRVLLIHPYIPARFNGAPMGLLYLAAPLLDLGHDVRILDLQALGGDSALFPSVATFNQKW